MWNLDSTVDRDVPCASVSACYRELPGGIRVPCDSAARSPACTGVIPAGQPHYHRDWGSLEESPDTRRYCRHCVREMNDRCSANKGPILVRVELTYSDGSVAYLEGDAADDWDRVESGASVMAGIHGFQGKSLPWQRRSTRA